MPEAIDLSKLGEKQEEENSGPQGYQVVATGFYVFITEDGNVGLDANSIPPGYRLMRAPHSQDIVGAVAGLKQTMAAQEAAASMITMMQQQAAVAMQQRQASDILGKVGPNLRG